MKARAQEKVDGCLERERARARTREKKREKETELWSTGQGAKKNTEITEAGCPYRVEGDLNRLDHDSESLRPVGHGHVEHACMYMGWGAPLTPSACRHQSASYTHDRH